MENECSSTRLKAKDVWQMMQDQYVYVGNIRTRFRAAGAHGPALILLHGLGATLESWHYNLRALGQHHRVFAPDIVWFGKTDKPRREPTFEFFAEFVSGFMRAVNAPRAVLVGNSMGGMLAAQTAFQYPEQAQGLVLVNSAGFGRELSWWLRLRSMVRLKPRGRPTPRMVRFALKNILYDERVITDEMVNLFTALESDPDSAEAYQRVIRSGVDWRGLKPNIVRGIHTGARTLQIPTLVVWGKQDRTIPVKHARVAQQLIPGAQLHIFERCGHAPMLERPDEFNALLTRFVRERIGSA